MSAVVLASSNNPLRAVTVESNDFDIDGGRRLSGMQAAAFLFAQGLRSIQAAADYNQQGVSDRSRATVRPPNPPFPANTAPVTIDQFAERIKELYGVDPLIEFSAGVGLDGYSIADINRIVDQINREFDFDLAPLDAQTILGAQSTVSDDARDARVSAVRVLTRTEVEGAARDGYLESGNVYVDRHGSFFLDGAKTSPVEISLAIRSAAHDNISSELATLLGKVAQRAQDSSYADEVKSSVDEILDANQVEAPTLANFEKIQSILLEIDNALEALTTRKGMNGTNDSTIRNEGYYGSGNLQLASLDKWKSWADNSWNHVVEKATNYGGWDEWFFPYADNNVAWSKSFNKDIHQVIKCFTGEFVAGHGWDGGAGEVDRKLIQQLFEQGYDDWTWNEMMNDTDDWHQSYYPDINYTPWANKNKETTWTDFMATFDNDRTKFPQITIAYLMEDLRALDPALVPQGWDSGNRFSQNDLKTWRTSTIQSELSRKADLVDAYQRGVTASTQVLADSAGTPAEQAAYKTLQAALEKAKADSGDPGLIVRLLQGAGQSSDKVVGGSVGDASTQTRFTRAQLQEIAAALGSVRERSLKDNEQDQIRMQKLNGLLTQNIEAMSALVKAFEQLTQSLVQSLKR